MACSHCLRSLPILPDSHNPPLFLNRFLRLRHLTPPLLLKLKSRPHLPLTQNSLHSSATRIWLCYTGVAVRYIPSSQTKCSCTSRPSSGNFWETSIRAGPSSSIAHLNAPSPSVATLQVGIHLQSHQERSIPPSAPSRLYMLNMVFIDFCQSRARVGAAKRRG